MASIDNGSTSKNNRLDKLQLDAIGSGMYMESPFSVTSGKINTCGGFDRINQSYKIILETMKEEVPMLPILGSLVHNMLFEQNDAVLQASFETSVTGDLNKLEKRSKILATNMLPNENELAVDFTYQITNTNIAHVFRYSIVEQNGGDVLE